VTPLIVVILAVAWVVVLVPPLLRSRSDGRPSTSIGSFRQQLATLSRTGPQRRGSVRPGRQQVVSARGAVRRPAGVPGYPPRLAAVPRYEPGYDDYEDYRDPRGYAAVGRATRMPGRSSRPVPIGYSMRVGRADVRRRRLNVLVALLALAGVTAVGGFGLGVSAMAGVNLLVDAILVFYVYLLVQVRRAEEERAMRESWSQAA
jgi:hypothetical protein